MLLLILSIGFTRAGFAMPLMSADMRMADCAMVMDATQDHDVAMHESHTAKPAAKAGHPHCLCVMCFPAIASALPHLDEGPSRQLPLPLNVVIRLPGGPEPVFPPPRMG